MIWLCFCVCEPSTSICFINSSLCWPVLQLTSDTLHLHHGTCGQRNIHFMVSHLSCQNLCLRCQLTHMLISAHCSDIPMAQFIINYNASLPQSQKFIIHILDGTHLFVSSNVDGMIRSAIQDFREKITYEKPA